MPKGDTKARAGEKRRAVLTLGTKASDPQRGMYDYTNDRLTPMYIGSPVSKLRVRRGFKLVYDRAGNSIPASVVHRAVLTTNAWLAQHMDTKFALAKSGKRVSSLDVHGRKAVGNFAGRAVCDNIQDITWGSPTGLRNTPIDAGCPDLIPAADAAGNHRWSQFRRGGIEVKATCGRLRAGAAKSLRYDDSRIERMSGVTWSAHHPHSTRVLGLLWDNVTGVPQIVAAFYATGLTVANFGNCKPDLSRRGGNSTNASAIKSRGIAKFGWVCVFDDRAYIDRIRHMMPGCGL